MKQEAAKRHLRVRDAYREAFEMWLTPQAARTPPEFGSVAPEDVSTLREIADILRAGGEGKMFVVQAAKLSRTQAGARKKRA
jgi:hypothetical protein